MLKVNKKNFFLVIFLIIILLPVKDVFGIDIDDKIIQNEKDNFGINTFIKKSKEFSGDFFDDMDLNEILNLVLKGQIDNKKIYKKTISIFGQEINQSLKSMVSILFIIVIHSILFSLSESLENKNISKLIYYVQYILIVTIIMNDFSNIINMIKSTIVNLVSFINLLIPILISLMIYTGSITTSSILEPVIIFMINFIGNAIQDIFIPFIMIIVSLNIISKISDRVQVYKISKFFQSTIIWVLGIVLTIFVGVVSLEGTLGSTIDGITAKTAKTIVSSAIPVVGKILGDVTDSVLGCGVVLKNAVGFIGVIIIFGICIIPIIKVFILMFIYKIIASISEVIADSKIVLLIEQMSNVFKILLAVLTTVSMMVIIGTTVLIKMSNSSVMFR